MVVARARNAREALAARAWAWGHGVHGRDGGTGGQGSRDGGRLPRARVALGGRESEQARGESLHQGRGVERSTRPRDLRHVGTVTVHVVVEVVVVVVVVVVIVGVVRLAAATIPVDVVVVVVAVVVEQLAAAPVGVGVHVAGPHGSSAGVVAEHHGLLGDGGDAVVDGHREALGVGGRGRGRGRDRDRAPLLLDHVGQLERLLVAVGSGGAVLWVHDEHVVQQKLLQHIRLALQVRHHLVDDGLAPLHPGGGRGGGGGGVAGRETVDALQDGHAQGPDVGGGRVALPVGDVRVLQEDLGREVPAGGGRLPGVHALAQEAKVGQLDANAATRVRPLDDQDVSRPDVAIHEGRLLGVEILQGREALAEDLDPLRGGELAGIQGPAGDVLEAQPGCGREVGSEELHNVLLAGCQSSKAKAMDRGTGQGMVQ
ncbi:hypothetical protein VTK73DRAFT_5437 [Phialemonium thermophilum]|uniref:Uncharacterized protein n=1 Tax=Phialemonium thermophilum TaxID=223376 RepID=A0ABR3V1V8_9PEZI